MMKLYFLVLFVSFFSPEETAQELVVEIQGIKDSQGQIAVLVFNRKDGFPSENTKAISQQIIPAKKGVVQVVFSGIGGAGNYAVSVMHDENNNLKLDTNWMGIPKEGYGFSGNKTGLMGPPSFDDAAFLLKDATEKIMIRMKY
jgi:uncharacterized protein (DUF2141 family)